MDDNHKKIRGEYVYSYGLPFRVYLLKIHSVPIFFFLPLGNN